MYYGACQHHPCGTYCGVRGRKTRQFLACLLAVPALSPYAVGISRMAVIRTAVMTHGLRAKKHGDPVRPVLRGPIPFLNSTY